VGIEESIGNVIRENLLYQGHRVVLTCRSSEKGKETVQELRALTNDSKVAFLVEDLSSVRRTRDLPVAKLILERLPTIDVLILHNAGLWPTEKWWTLYKNATVDN
jgi:NADP-dependent 3-hydroxy acid dehydrogenase YdfG